MVNKHFIYELSDVRCVYDVCYQCMPKLCGCADTIPCSFDYLDEEYVLKVRGKYCITSIDNMYMVDVKTQEQVEIRRTMTW